MKIRTGFVSNSSSSSFIIGIVNNKDGNYQFKKEEITSNDWYGKYLKGIPTHILVKELDNDTYQLKIESFNGDVVSCVVKDGDKFTYLYGTGPDGDDFFWDGDCCDYDKIELDDFDTDDISLYNIIQEMGGDVSYGAGRDG